MRECLDADRGAGGRAARVGVARPRRRARAGARARRGGAARAAARAAGRRQGRHRHRRHADRLRLADLRGPPPRARRGLRRLAARAGRGDPRQDRQTEFATYQPPVTVNPHDPDAHARRLVERLGRRGRGRDGAGRLRHPDRRLGDPAGVVLRRRRLQAPPRLGVDRPASSASAPGSTRSAPSAARSPTPRCSPASSPPPASRGSRSAARRGWRRRPRWRRRPGARRRARARAAAEFAGLPAAQEALMAHDVAHNLAPEYRDHRDGLSQVMREYIERGQAVPAEEAEAARRARGHVSRGVAGRLGRPARPRRARRGAAAQRGPHRRPAAVPRVDAARRAGDQRAGAHRPGRDAGRRAARRARRGGGAGGGGRGRGGAGLEPAPPPRDLEEPLAGRLQRLHRARLVGAVGLLGVARAADDRRRVARRPATARRRR